MNPVDDQAFEHLPGQGSHWRDLGALGLESLNNPLHFYFQFTFQHHAIVDDCCDPIQHVARAAQFPGLGLHRVGAAEANH